MIEKLNHILLIVFFSTLSCVGTLCAQDQKAIDSLINILQEENITTSKSAEANVNLAGQFYKYDRDTAFHYAFIGLDLARKSSNKYLIAKALVQTCLKDVNAGKYEEALISLNEADKLLKGQLENTADQNEIDRTILLLLRNKGTVFNYQNKHEEAISTHLEALDLAEKTENLHEATLANYNIAVVHFSTQNFERARYYQSQAHTKALHLNTPALVASSLNLGGVIFFYQGELDSAKVYSSQALAIAKKNNLIQASLEAANVLSTIHYQNERYDSAAIYSLDLLSFAQELGDKYYIASLTGSLAEIYSKLNDIKKARYYYKQFEILNEELNNLQLGKLNYANYSEFETSQGNHKRANELLHKYFNIQDSLYTKENRQIQVDLEAKYESAKKDAEISEQNEKITTQNNQRNLLITGSLLGLLLAYFFWSRNKMSTKLLQQEKEISSQKINQLQKEKKILAMNAMLEGQEAERMRIAKDLHDGLGGLLSTVKARLSNINSEVKKIESYNIYEKTTSMVDEACDEVRRISHNLLPGALRLEGLKSAVEQLGEELSEAHPFTVKVETIGFEGEIDETKEVFLYRIIQEASNNIIKHGKATEVLIQLSETKKEYHLTIEDDGIGFDNSNLTDISGMGLKSIQSRVDFLQGDLDISSTLGTGTTISIHIPKVHE